MIIYAKAEFQYLVNDLELQNCENKILIVFSVQMYEENAIVNNFAILGTKIVTTVLKGKF